MKDVFEPLLNLTKDKGISLRSVRTYLGKHRLVAPGSVQYVNNITRGQLRQHVASGKFAILNVPGTGSNGHALGIRRFDEELSMYVIHDPLLGVPSQIVVAFVAELKLYGFGVLTGSLPNSGEFWRSRRAALGALPRNWRSGTSNIASRA